MSKHKTVLFIFITLVAITLAACSDSYKLQPLPADATVLAFGDSLTYGTGSSRDKAYPSVLESLIKHRVINAGIPGEISKKGLARLGSLIEKYRPGLTIICHGGNDILRKLDLSRTSDNIQQMIDLARENNSQVVLIGVPEFGLFLSSSPIYQQLADKNQLPIENDILGEIIGNNALKSDHIHPNSQGYQLLAERIANLLRATGALTEN